MTRSEKKYGLAPLTFAEAARVLGIDVPTLEVFVMKTIRPGSDRWTKWSNGTLPLPEVVVRLYLTRLRAESPAEVARYEAEIEAEAAAVPITRLVAKAPHKRRKRA